MNKLIILCALALCACSPSFDLQGNDPNEYYKQHPIENKVGPHGELISPDCPDWKTSPNTTFSNTRQANIGCATTTNLGLMLEDPRDLVRGSSGGHIPPDPERSAIVIKNYKNGVSTSSPSNTPVTGGASSEAAPPAAQ